MEGTEGQDLVQENVQGINPGMSSLMNALGDSSPELNEYLKNAANTSDINSDEDNIVKNDDGQKPPAIEESGEVDDINKDELNASEKSTEEITNEEEDVIDSPFFGGKKKLSPSEPENEEIKTFEDVSEVLKSKLGVSSMEKLSETLDAIVQQRDEASKIKSQLENVDLLFQNMPPEMYRAIQNWQQGADWKAELSGVRLDYSKSVESFDNKAIVDALSPGKVTEDQWREYLEEDGDPNVKAFVNLVIESSKEKFVKNAEGIKSSAEEMVKQNAERAEKFNQSVKESRSYFEEKFKDADKKWISDISNAFESGKIGELFFNQDGTMKSDAMLRYAMAQDGESLLEQTMKKIENKKQTLVHQEILKQIKDTPSGRNGSNGAKKNDLRPEVQAKLDLINGVGSTDKHRF